MKKIYMFASFGDWSKQPKGGGQTSSRRMFKTLTDLGFDVEIIKRHRFYKKNRIVDNFYKFFWLLSDPFIFACKLMFRQRKDSIVLILSYCGSMMPFEFILTVITNLLRFKNVFYYKGGGGNKLYDEGSYVYRKLFNWTMSHYDDVLVEGQSGVKLVEAVGAKRVFYLPNFTENGFAPEKYPNKSKNSINIMYFGRIHLYKNVLLIIDIFERLCRKNANVNLLLVGTGDKEYEKLVHKKIQESQFCKNIEWLPWVDHDRLKDLLAKQHFFLFPSTEPREGHSNSLNEAMSYGLIPVVSKNNYLPDIVGEESLVAKDMTVEAFAKIIENIIDNKKIDIYGIQMYNRVKQNFIQDIVEKKLKKELEILI